MAWLGRSRRQAVAPASSTSSAAEAAQIEAPRFARLAWSAPTAGPSGLEVVLPDGVTVRGEDPAAMLVLLRALAAGPRC